MNTKLKERLLLCLLALTSTSARFDDDVSHQKSSKETRWSGVILSGGREGMRGISDSYLKYIPSRFSESERSLSESRKEEIETRRKDDENRKVGKGGIIDESLLSLTDGMTYKPRDNRFTSVVQNGVTERHEEPTSSQSQISVRNAIEQSPSEGITASSARKERGIYGGGNSYHGHGFRGIGGIDNHSGHRGHGSYGHGLYGGYKDRDEAEKDFFNYGAQHGKKHGYSKGYSKGYEQKYDHQFGEDYGHQHNQGHKLHKLRDYGHNRQNYGKGHHHHQGGHGHLGYGNHGHFLNKGHRFHPNYRVFRWGYNPIALPYGLPIGLHGGLHGGLNGLEGLYRYGKLNSIGGYGGLGPLGGWRGGLGLRGELYGGLHRGLFGSVHAGHNGLGLGLLGQGRLGYGRFYPNGY